MSKKKLNIVFVCLTIIFPILYGLVFIRNFSEPLSGGGDIDEWEYVGYYLANNISFNPFPSISFNHNQTFYPFGTTQVFSDWSLESNYWFAFFYKNWGHGPWLNIYYVLSLIISFLGTFLVIKPDFGSKKAFFTGFVVTFFNFYALNKYPHHYNHSTIHWAILSLLTDFILLKRICLSEGFSLKWVFLKAFILLACLGMNLGYICGFALNSFTICIIFALILLIKRHFEGVRYPQLLFNNWLTEFKNKPYFFLFLSIPILLVGFLFLPLVLQIYFEAKTYKLDGLPAPHFWSNPLRMLLPYFPHLNALHNPFVNILKDMPEGLGSGSPGWFCLGLGLIGFFSNRREYGLIFIPFLILLIISTFYHPNRIPTLKIFPWGAYNRVPSRFTSLLPVIFASFFLPTDSHRIPNYKIIIGIFTTFFVIELSVVLKYRFEQSPFVFESNFFPYMEVVKNQRGEAVLDFPYCIVGGDGTGLKENLCPIFTKTCNIYALRRFHEKKVIGGYYSHVPQGAVDRFVKIGIGNWVKPNIDSWQFASHIVNVMDNQQLEHFIKYFQYNDFAGINLYVDLIPNELAKQIIEHIGQPISSTISPGAGKVVFIPKPKGWYQFINKNKSKQMHFPCGCS